MAPSQSQPLPLSLPLNLNFVTSINKIYPSPISKVFLVFNESGDLSLYRENEQIWSAGRFKTLEEIDWSPDGKNCCGFNIEIELFVVVFREISGC